MAYPASVQTFTNVINGVTPIEAANINGLYAEVTAIEQGLLNGFQHNLVPQGTRDIGLSGNRWNQGWFNGNVTTAAQFVGSGAGLTNVPAAAITGTGIPESALNDDGILARLADDETVTGAWTFSNTVLTLSGGSATLQFTGTGNKAIDAAVALIIEIDSIARFTVGTTIINAILPLNAQAGISGDGSGLTGIPETAITDGLLLARLAANETITGAWTFDGSFLATGIDVPMIMQGQIRRTNVIGAGISFDTNNWNPAGLSTASRINVNNTLGGELDITGIVAQPDGTVITVTIGTTSTGDIILVNNSVSSVAANRLLLRDNQNLELANAVGTRRSASFLYDGGLLRWIQIA